MIRQWYSREPEGSIENDGSTKQDFGGVRYDNKHQQSNKIEYNIRLLKILDTTTDIDAIEIYSLHMTTDKLTNRK